MIVNKQLRIIGGISRERLIAGELKYLNLCEKHAEQARRSTRWAHMRNGEAEEPFDLNKLDFLAIAFGKKPALLEPRNLDFVRLTSDGRLELNETVWLGPRDFGGPVISALAPDEIIRARKLVASGYYAR